MDRSLWLLLRLRYAGAVRRWFRRARTPKGAILALIGAFVFVPMFLGALVGRQARSGLAVDDVRQYGALALAAYCFLSLLLTSGEHALYYTPAEVGFLFPGPYKPRQLVLYKIATGLVGSALTAVFLVFAFAQHTPRFLSGYVGLVLAFEFMTLFSLAFGLATNVVSAAAFTRGRRILLGVLLAVIGVVAATRGAEVLRTTPARVLPTLLDSPFLQAVLLPFRPPVYAFTSTAVWPDLIGWAAVSLAIDAALVALILRLNAQFYETSAAASARLYEQIRRKQRGQATYAKPTNVRARVPMAPWWGGAGPNLWRQFTTLVRTPSRLYGLVALLIAPPVLMIFLVPRKDSGTPIAVAGLSMLATMGLLAPSMVGFDFRTDLDRMETLKTLPVPPARLAIGQILTPALLITTAEWITVAILAFASPKIAAWLFGLACLLLPLNLLLVGIENAYFLWFPFRMAASTGFDFQAIGRQMILFAGKFLTAGVAASLAAGLGAIGYFGLGRSWPAAFVGAWIGLTACALALIPLVGEAFRRFDVTEVPAD